MNNAFRSYVIEYRRRWYEIDVSYDRDENHISIDYVVDVEDGQPCPSITKAAYDEFRRHARKELIRERIAL